MDSTEENEDMQTITARLDHEWVQVLINLRMKYARSFTGKRHSAATAWNIILREMHELGAPRSISRLKIKKKWMNLVAKYKQLKHHNDVKTRSTWPYFEQIDRAFCRKRNDSNQLPENLEQFCVNHLSDDDLKKSKENFMRMLIDLRYKYRHLFTGKKYAAQKGWMVIQNYLPSGEQYSVDQMSKVWHNLVQRYKMLIDNEEDHSKITWKYFQQLHKIMSQQNTCNEGINAIEFVGQPAVTFSANEIVFSETQNPLECTKEEKLVVIPFLGGTGDGTGNECSTENGIVGELEPELAEDIANDHSHENVTNKHKSSTSLDDILNYLKERDQRKDEQMKQLLEVMQSILFHLKRD